MSVEAITAVKYIDCPTPSTKLVLFILANYADERGSCFPSENHLGKICGISSRQVRRCIKNLEAMEVVTVESRVGTSNRYFLALDAIVRGGGVTSVRGGGVTGGRAVMTPVSAYTKDKQKKRKRRTLNDIAG